jgi:hypothetical protein
LPLHKHEKTINVADINGFMRIDIRNIEVNIEVNILAGDHFS